MPDVASPTFTKAGGSRTHTTKTRRTRVWPILRPALLIVVLIVAGWLRFTGLNWDEDQLLHPDERYVGVLASTVRTPQNLSEYFDSGASPLNPFNTSWGRDYVYGTLPLFVGRFAAEWLDSGCISRDTQTQPAAPAGVAAAPRLIAHLLVGEEAVECQRGAFTGFTRTTLIGRAISALADLLTLLTLFLTGRRLFGWRVGLLATALSGAAVLQIQSAHFYTVDSMAVLFTMLTLYFCARMVTRQSSVGDRRSSIDARFGVLADGLLAGLMAGCALASKVSVWPLIPLIVLSGIVALARDRSRGPAPIWRTFAALVLAGVGAFAAFRVAQPYAFVGSSQSEFELTLAQCAGQSGDLLNRVCALAANLPEPVRVLVAPSGRWIQKLALAQGFVNGTIDVPFGHQWANRTPIVFPLINLVFWGMGIPLGLAACAGLLAGLRQLWRGRRWWAYLIPVLWGGVYFVYQSTQWTKSMRYLLPIYPVLCLLAAAWLIALWRGGQLRRVGKGARRRMAGLLNPAILIGVVLAGALAWALAFTTIYRQPVSRLAATYWAYENIPTALTAEWLDDNGAVTDRYQLPLRTLSLTPGQSQTVLLHAETTEGAVSSAESNPPGDSGVLRLTLNKLQGVGDLLATLIDPATGQEIAMARTVVSPDNPTLRFPDIPRGRMYLIAFEHIAGDDLLASTSVVANEHWDDAVPRNLPGKDAYGMYYVGLSSSSDGQIQNYAEDAPEKLPQVLNWLDEADYLVLSSNRLYGSIPRLPWRFPMATEYYRALFNGELGFELAADFHSFPRIGPLHFNDQEMPQPLRRSPKTQGTPAGIWMPYPTAEEAFSVYDHPRVLIFRKTPAYSRALAEQVLGKYDLTRVIRQTPLQAVNTPRGMLFDDTTRAAQQAGGTWRELFPRESLLNQSQALAVLAWLALIEALGLAAFPLLFAAVRDRESRIQNTESRTQNSQSATPNPKSNIQHPKLLDGGYAFSKVLGLLLVAFVTWWLGSARIAMFTAAQIWTVVAALGIAGLFVWWRYRHELGALLKARAGVILATELVFLIGFGLWLLVRAGNPDLWHPYMGGEKPMDFAYLNAVLKSSYFPPYDPWFAGGYINYYYFGFVLIGAPIKALGIDPAIAYNLAVPTLFGLTACGAFGLGASFYAWRAGQPGTARASVRTNRAIVAGTLAAVFVVGIGNWGQPDVILPAWQKLGGIEDGTPALVATLNGILKWVQGQPLPIYPNWPYWNPTRLHEAVPIAEFPQFTFLYADLHAHMIAMPLAYLAMALALALAGGARRWFSIVMAALVVGALWPTNSWDYPVYLLLTLAAIAIGAAHEARCEGRACVGAFVRMALPAMIVFVVLTRAFYVPYLENYGSAYNQIDRWQAETTPLSVYRTIYGIFLIPLIVYFAWGVWRTLQRTLQRTLLRTLRSRSPGARRQWLVVGLIVSVATGALALILAGQHAPIAIIAVPMMTLAALAAVMPGASGPTRALWLMTAGAFALTVFVELFTLRGDIGRMNTVFKFYIQAWLLLSISAPVACVWQVERMSDKPMDATTAQPARRRLSLTFLKGAFVAGMTVSLFVAALYPAFAIPAKINDRYTRAAPQGLDGMAYMRYAERFEGIGGKERTFPLRYDYDAIRWMQDHVAGSPVIIEGTTGGNLYRWGNRFSIYTGLTAVVGWQWHQRQQRAALSDRIVYDRDDDLSEFYNTPDIGRALTLIRRYNAAYIIVGDLERVYYNEAGFSKFDEMVRLGYLAIAYQNPGTTIYHVKR